MIGQWIMDDVLKNLRPHTLTSYWEEVKSTISPEDKWVAGYHALDDDGKPCMHWANNATRFSSYGAMCRTMYYGERFGRTHKMDGLTTPIMVFQYVIGMHPILFEAISDYKRVIEALDEIIKHCKQKGL